ncbi:MAG: hypothetical protein ACREXK_02295 [Gammaproteobacteria bacterium]
MNKRLCLSTAALTLLIPIAAFADEPTGPTVWDGFSGWLSPDWDRDFSATLGVKVWINEWSRDSFISQRAQRAFDVGGGEVIVVPTLVDDTAPDSQESDIEPVPIPQLSARYKWLFATGSYYSKTGFDFEPTFGRTRLIDSAGNPGDLIRLIRFETSGERYEWDASGGIYVHPYVAILGGYKKVRQTIDQTVTGTDIEVGTLAVGRSYSDIDIEGPTIGIAASVPIGRGFGVYATYAHGFMDAGIRDVTTSPCCSDDGDQNLEFDADYDVAEAGFSYTHGMDRLMPHLPLSAATVYAGYRYQAISTDFEEQDGQDRSDVTRGFAVGVNLTF